MARNFIIGSSQYIDFPKIDTLLGTSYTIAQRFKINAVQSTQLGLANHRSTTDANTAFFHFTILATTGLLRIIIQKDGTNFALVDSSAAPSTGVWHSAIGTRSVDTAELFLDGVSEGTDTSPGAMGTIVSDDYKIGALDSGGGAVFFMDGDIADVAVWSVILTQNEIDAYNKGVSPTLIRPDKLVSYIPLWGTTQEPDLGGNGGIGTFTNSPAISTTNPAVMSYKKRNVTMQASLIKKGFCVNGIVQENGVNVARTVRVYLSSTGALLGSITSDAITGEYTICGIPDESNVFVVAFDDVSGESFNAKIFDKVVPVE